jgi:hypothetical protein
MKIKEVWVDTGEEIIRDATAEELTQKEIDDQNEADRKAEIATKAAKRAELLSKLGISEEEAQLLLS